MASNKEIKFVERTYIKGSEGLCFYENNRCFTNDEKICKELGFSKQAVAIFERRMSKIAKSVEKFSFLECCEVKLIRLKGVLYIADGQSRIVLVDMINKGKPESEKIAIPCLIYEAESEEAMSKHIRGMNMCNTNWNQLDNLRCEVRTTNNVDSLIKLNKVNEIEAYLGINNSNACDMVLGQGSRKLDTDWSKRKIWEDIDDFANWLATIYELCEKEEWTKAEIQRLKSQKFLEALKENIYKKVKRISPLMLQEVKGVLRLKICTTEKDMRGKFTNNKDSLKRMFIDMIDASRKKNMKDLAFELRTSRF